MDAVVSWSAEAPSSTSLSKLDFSDFYAQHREGLARALALTIGDADLAGEAVDEAMVRAYQRWATINAQDNPAGWVYRVAMNWSLSVFRRRRRPQRRQLEREPQDVGYVTEPTVAVALAELDVRQRAVVICRFYLGLSEQETSEALGIRPGTVKSRLHRALRHLHARLAHLDPGAFA